MFTLIMIQNLSPRGPTEASFLRKQITMDMAQNEQESLVGYSAV
jgi:hypothetical protein